ncbi:MAG: NfeD family protein [Planctomycetales bacterium]|nr:NfeD family protein [Planctomycetales bacterium]
MNFLDPLALAILLLAAGCLLAVLEVFIPSGGIIGFLAALCLIASLVVAFRRDVTTGLAFITMVVIAVPVAVGLAFKVWPYTPMGKAFLGELPTEAEVAPDDERRSLVGRTGIAKSLMLPSGSVAIEGRLIDAVSQGAAIEPGTPVVVVEVRANRVLVRPAEGDEAQQIVAEQGDVLSKPIEDFGLESFEDPLA